MRSMLLLTEIIIVVLLPGLCLLLGYHYVYTIHGSPYTSAHVLIENTLVQHKIAKNSRMALCCQNQVSKGTNQHYGLHVRASSLMSVAYCMQCIVSAAEDLDKSCPVQCTVNLH